MPENNTLIFIPTYNELENVERIFNEIKSLNLKADVLFLDDNSPDGTGKVIDRISQNENNVFAIHRSGKMGIGSAHQEGIQWAYKNNYELFSYYGL
jgi:dolichol-phosphate mannosyltransferase